MKLGIGTYAFMWSIGFDKARPAKPMTAMGLLEKARELGVSLVQVGPNLPLDALSSAELDAFAAKAREWKITLELATRGLDKEHLARQIELAKRLDVSLIRTIPELGGKPALVEQCPGALAAVLPLFSAAKMRLAIENGKIPAEDLRKLLDDVANPSLGIVYDTVNSIAVPEGWRHVALALAPHVMCLHMKDYVAKRVWSMMGFIIEGTPAGKGQIDFPWLLNTFKASRYPYNVVLELWPPEQPKLEDTIKLEHQWAVESIPYLRKFIKD